MKRNKSSDGEVRICGVPLRHVMSLYDYRIAAKERKRIELFQRALEQKERLKNGSLIRQADVV